MRIGFAGPIQGFSLGHVRVRFLVGCAAPGHSVVGKERGAARCQSGIWTSSGQLARYIGGMRVVGGCVMKC